MRSFTFLLGALLNEHDLTQSRFAEMVGCDQGFLSQVLKEKRRPPLEHIEKWGAMFELTDGAMEEFVLSAHLTKSTPLIREYVTDLEDQLKT